MLRYNLLEYSLNYSDMTGSLCFYLKDEVTNFNADMGIMLLLSLFSIKVSY